MIIRPYVGMPHGRMMGLCSGIHRLHVLRLAPPLPVSDRCQMVSYGRPMGVRWDPSLPARDSYTSEEEAHVRQYDSVWPCTLYDTLYDRVWPYTLYDTLYDSVWPYTLYDTLYDSVWPYMASIHDGP